MTATIARLRRYLFELVDRASRGEPIIVRNNAVVARLLPTGLPDWRGHMSTTPRVRMADDEAFRPLDDWEPHAWRASSSNARRHPLAARNTGYSLSPTRIATIGCA